MMVTVMPMMTLMMKMTTCLSTNKRGCAIFKGTRPAWPSVLLLNTAARTDLRNKALSKGKTDRDLPSNSNNFHDVAGQEKAMSDREGAQEEHPQEEFDGIYFLN